MDEKIQEQLDQQLETAKKARLLDEGETSDAPLLDAAVLGREYKRTEMVEINVDSQSFQVEVLRGSPLTASLLLDKTPEVYALKEQIENDPNREFNDEEIVQIDSTNRNFRRIMVVSHIVNPKFAYQEIGEGHPIENISETMLEALFEAYQVVNTPQEAADQLNRFQEVESNEDGENASAQPLPDGQ